MKIKEFGSDFHYETNPDWHLEQATTSQFFFEDSQLVTSGREALYGVIANGITQFNWKTIYFPSYYCHEVVNYLKPLPVDIEYYDYNPFTDECLNFENIKDAKTSVFINVNFFGLKKLDSSFLSHSFIIDDFTYSIDNYKISRAHYCIGSLRKELPVFAGGFCYSAHNLKLPNFNKISKNNAKIAKVKSEAMSLKTAYLAKENIEKDHFRALYGKAEGLIENHNLNGSMSSATLKHLKNLAISKILLQKKQNLELIANNLEITNGIVFNNQVGKQGYGIVLYLDTPEIRNYFKSKLIENHIYPAVLWPHQRNEFAAAIARRMLFIHLDYRHNYEDVYYICQKIENISNGFKI